MVSSGPATDIHMCVVGEGREGGGRGVRNGVGQVGRAQLLTVFIDTKG